MPSSGREESREEADEGAYRRGRVWRTGGGRVSHPERGVPGQDITIYEADERMGGGFFLGGSAESGYNVPGSVFDNEFRCTFDLLQTIPSASDPAVSVKDEFFAFNARYPFHDRARLIDRNGRIVHGPRFGLGLRDGFELVRLVLTPEAKLDGRRIEEFFSPRFFSTEFWLIYSTIMGSLPQHGATELRRYLNRTLHLFPDLSDMAHILRTPLNQYQAFIEPLVAWLRPRGVNFLTGAFVQDIGFAASPGHITVNRLDYERGGAATSIAVAPEDLVLVTFGSQAADLSVGSMTEAPGRGATDGLGSCGSAWRRGARISAIPTRSSARRTCPTRAGCPSRSPRRGLNSSTRWSR